MLQNLQFDVDMMESMIGGRSALDIGSLRVQSLEDAYQFIKSYGFDIEKANDEKKLWTYHRRAVTYLKTELLVPGEVFPEILSDPNQLKDIANLLIFASTKDNRDHSLQRWSCALLKVIHIFVHLESDIFSAYSDEIQNQILGPIRDHIYSDPVAGIFLGKTQDEQRISLKKFDTKSFKSSDSSVTKLLAKPDAVAFTLLDKVGVRFITKHLFDAFRVTHYLLNHNLVSFPHNITDQSSNTLYPLNIFFEVLESFSRNSDMSVEKMDILLKEKLASSIDRAQYREKLNHFSAKDYSFMKFITRRLIRVKIPNEDKMKTLRFFYPYEVQIVDYETYLKNLSGESSHDKYKARQREKARLRVFGR